MQLELSASKISIAMEATSQTLPGSAGDQILGGGGSSNNIPQAVPSVSSSSSSSGSIGPFFAVISVLTILAVLSCFLGRRLTRDQMVPTPVESIRERIDWFGWLKRKCRQLQCMVAHHDLEVGSKVMVMDLGQEKKGDARVKEGDHEVPPQKA